MDTCLWWMHVSECVCVCCVVLAEFDAKLNILMKSHPITNSLEVHLSQFQQQFDINSVNAPLKFQFIAFGHNANMRITNICTIWMYEPMSVPQAICMIGAIIIVYVWWTSQEIPWLLFHETRPQTCFSRVVDSYFISIGMCDICRPTTISQSPLTSIHHQIEAKTIFDFWLRIFRFKYVFANLHSSHRNQNRQLTTIRNRWTIYGDKKEAKTCYPFIQAHFPSSIVLWAEIHVLLHEWVQSAYFGMLILNMPFTDISIWGCRSIFVVRDISIHFTQFHHHFNWKSQ